MDFILNNRNNQKILSYYLTIYESPIKSYGIFRKKLRRLNLVWEVITIITRVSPRTLGDLKQAIMKEYNKVNQEIFNVGVTEQQISMVDNKIFLMAKHKRIPVLKIIDESNQSLSDAVDQILIEKFKMLFESSLRERFGFEVYFIFKDYDPLKEMGGTVIVLDKSIETYMTG